MHILGAIVVAIFVALDSSPAIAFTAPEAGTVSFARTQTRRFFSGSSDDYEASSSTTTSVQPQVFATGYSNDPDLHTALQQAVNSALAALPPLDGAGGADDSQATRGRSHAKIDLAFVTTSSLYNASPATVVPAVLSSASVYGRGIDKLIGCTSGGTISSVVGAEEGGEGGSATAPASRQSTGKGEGSAEDAVTVAAAEAVRECRPVETEGVPGVSVTLALLPDVDVSVSSLWTVVRFISKFAFIYNLTLACKNWLLRALLRHSMPSLMMSLTTLGAFPLRNGTMRSV